MRLLKFDANITITKVECEKSIETAKHQNN